MATLNLNNLEYFFSLVETTSFSKTAIALKVGQSAVSKRIRALEDELQVQLFLRNKSEVVLTPEGKNLWERLRPAYQELNSKLNNFLIKDEELTGKLVFACYQEVGEKVFIHALNGFKKLHPKLFIEIKFLNSAAIIDGVKNGEIDIGIIANSLIMESIRTYPVYDETIVLTTTPVNKHKKILAIKSASFVTYKENDQILLRYLKRLYPKISLNMLNVEFAVSSHRSMIETIKAHDYYAVVPYLSIQEEVEANRLIIVGDKHLKSKLHLIHLDLNYRISNIEILKKYLIEYLK